MSLLWSPVVPSAFWSVAVIKTSSNLSLTRTMYGKYFGSISGFITYFDISAVPYSGVKWMLTGRNVKSGKWQLRNLRVTQWCCFASWQALTSETSRKTSVPKVDTVINICGAWWCEWHVLFASAKAIKNVWRALTASRGTCCWACSAADALKGLVHCDIEIALSRMRD